MSANKRPDPTVPGHIEGQNPATPERLPRHTADVASVPAGSADNESELGGRPAFLFEAGEHAGVTLESSGANLPSPAGNASWQLTHYFTLGVRDAGLEDVSPEPMIRGILARGFYIWRKSAPSQGRGTSQ